MSEEVVYECDTAEISEQFAVEGLEASGAEVDWGFDFGSWDHQPAAINFIVQKTHQLSKLKTKPRIIVASPTGAGKSRIVMEAMKRLNAEGKRTAFVVNRRTLITQFSDSAKSDGISFSMLASGYGDGDLSAPNVIIAADTLISRVLKKDGASMPLVDVVFIDEAHLNCNGGKFEILKRFTDSGAIVYGITATPIGMAHAYDDIAIFGTNSELRKCGALMPAMVYGPDEPDMRHIKRVNVEFVQKDVEKWFGKHRHQIFGRVLEFYKILNPQQRPAILFAPGLGESVWFVDELEKAGVSAVHIDGEDIYRNGQYLASDPVTRKKVFEQVRNGQIKIISNRHVMREGIDLPELYHEIIATPIGSLRSYIQIVGRVLRHHKSLDDVGHVVIQDHGGNWWRHGSPNMDRDWQELWRCPENYSTEFKASQHKEGKEPEPINCPQCRSIRASGRQCQKCGYVADLSRRSVWQVNGDLKDLHGAVYKPMRRKKKEDTEDIWRNMVIAAKRSKSDRPMTWRQAEALFFLRHGYYPPRDIFYMPKDDAVMWWRIRETPNSELIMPGAVAKDVIL